MRNSLLLLVIAGLVFFTGCQLFGRYTYISDRYPIYDLPLKSKIFKLSKTELSPLTESTKVKILKTVHNLKVEAAQLRAKLKSYNEYAKLKNTKYSRLFKKKR